MANISSSNNSMSTSTLGSSPLHRLASYFENARKRPGTISLPNRTLDTIKKYREQWSQHSGREVDAIVRALEPTSTDVCERLDSMALVVICSVLVHTESCLAQQRGLCLLTEMLHGSESASSQAVAERQGKKIATGQQALIPLIKGFTKSCKSDHSRRWMGVLALELLKGCEQNVALLQDDAPTLQSLKEVIEHGRCQILKLLAGSIIHTMLCAGVMPQLVWPRETDMGLYSQFPIGQHYDTQWITAFEGFVEELGQRNALTQEKSCVMFAFALIVGPSRHATDDQSAILVTVSEDLNIIIPNSATGPATYIDVPLDHINSATIDSRANSQSQTPNHVFSIKLANNDGTTCYLNASRNDSSSIALVFTAENDAKTLMRLVQPKAIDEKKTRHYSQSEAIDISQAFSDDISEDELAVPSPRNNQELRIMATQAASFLARDPPAHTSHRASQGLPTVSQRPVFRGRPFQQSSNVAQYVERSMSVAMGVDVSQPAPLSSTQTDKGLLKGDIGNQQILRNCDRTSDTGLPRSLRWKKANDSIDNAPEFRNSESNVAEQQAAEILSPKNQAEDYDSTYDVSPQYHKSRPHLSRLNSSPPQPLRTPDGSLDDQNHTDRGVRLEAQEKISSSPGAAAVSKLWAQTSKFPIVVPNPLNAGDGSTDNALPTKLSKRLRTVEGEVEDGIGPLVHPESPPTAEKGAQEKPNSKTLPKRKLSAIAKTQAGIQKQVKPSRRPAVKNGKAKARADRVSDKGDEYNLESSPEPIEDSAKAATKRPVRSQLQASRGRNDNAETSAARPDPKGSRLGSKAPPKARASKTRPQKDDGLEEESIWEMPRLVGNEPSRGFQRKGAKQTDAQPLPAPKEKKASRPPAKTKPRPGSKPAPAALMQPRSRRAAAIKANKKFQGLEESDESTDVNDLQTKARRMRSSAAVEKIGNTSAATVRINEELPEDEDTAQAPPVLQPRAQIPRSAEVAKNNVSVDVTRHKMKDPVLDSKVDTGSPEQIALIQESLAPSHEDTGTEEPLKHTDPVVPSLQKATVQKDLLIQEPGRSANDDTADSDHKEQNDQPKQPSVLHHISEIPSVIPESEESMASDIIPDHYLQTVHIGMLGDTEDSYFQEAMPETAGGSFHPDQAQLSLDTAADLRSSDKSTSVRSPRRDENRKVAVDSRDIHSQAQDPFEAKLGPLVSKPKKFTGQYRAAQSSDNTKIAKDQKTVQAKASNGIQGKPVKQLRKVKETDEAARSLPVTTELQHARLQENVALPNSKLSGSAPSEKRIMDDDYRIQEKSVRMRACATNDAPTKANERKQATDAKTPLPVAGLKPGLISWTVSGPRNQGTISAKQRISHNETRAEKPNEDIPRVQHDEKEKIAPCLDDPAPWEHDHHGRRQCARSQGRLNTTPRHNPKHVPPMISEQALSVIHERARRLGSQSTKVNENGSPMPFGDQSHQRVHREAIFIDVQSAFNDGMLAEEGVCDTYQPQLPTVTKDTMPEINGLAFASMTSNRKQVPDSPHAPSTHAIIPPHVVLHSGEMVNEKTLENIVPTLPQDPFVGGNPRPPSSFMNLLRKSTAAERRRKSKEYSKKKSSRMVKWKSFGEEDDPDRTLVEPEPKRQKKSYYTHLASSSTSDTTSRGNTPAEESSDPESDSTTIRWEKTLEPYQANMLDVLSHITHRLVRHLVEKETATKDIVDDYGRRGNLLLQGYDDGRRQGLESDRAGLELSRRKLAIMYTQTQANLRKTSKEMSKRSTRVLGARVAQWHHQQQGLESAIDRAIAACVDG